MQALIVDLTVAIVCCCILYGIVLWLHKAKKEYEDAERKFFEDAINRHKQ